jgi:hypothetical protein
MIAPPRAASPRGDALSHTGAGVSPAASHTRGSVSPAVSHAGASVSPGDGAVSPRVAVVSPPGGSVSSRGRPVSPASIAHCGRRYRWLTALFLVMLPASTTDGGLVTPHHTVRR